MAKRRYTQEMRKAQAEGHTIVVASTIMHYPGPGTRTHEWPVVYRPRYTTDAHPWLALMQDGTAPSEEEGYTLRYSGREVTLESRYIVDKIDEDYFQVLDLVTDLPCGTFNGVVIGQTAYRRADLYALNLNRENRREITGYPV